MCITSRCAPNSTLNVEYRIYTTRLTNEPSVTQALQSILFNRSELQAARRSLQVVHPPPWEILRGEGRAVVQLCSTSEGEASAFG